MKTVFVLAAAGLAALAAAAPAEARTSVSVGMSFGSGGYYAPYYGGYYGSYYRSPFYDDFAYSRAARRACFRDPWCSGYGYGYSPFYAPVYVAPPPVVVYERTDRYDPLPRWRGIAPQTSGYQYGYSEPAPAYSAYAGAASAPSYPDASPISPDGHVRYDLARQGYTARDLQPASSDSYGAYQRYDQVIGAPGAADSYIRGGSQDPDQTLLGGPR